MKVIAALLAAAAATCPVGECENHFGSLHGFTASPSGTPNCVQSEISAWPCIVAYNGGDTNEGYIQMADTDAPTPAPTPAPAPLGCNTAHCAACDGRFHCQRCVDGYFLSGSVCYKNAPAPAPITCSNFCSSMTTLAPNDVKTCYASADNKYCQLDILSSFNYQLNVAAITQVCANYCLLLDLQSQCSGPKDNGMLRATYEYKITCQCIF